MQGLVPVTIRLLSYFDRLIFINLVTVGLHSYAGVN